MTSSAGAMLIVAVRVPTSPVLFPSLQEIEKRSQPETAPSVTVFVPGLIPLNTRVFDRSALLSSSRSNVDGESPPVVV